MAIRQIEDRDIEQVERLLCEGFPSKRAAYWRHALMLLQRRPVIADLPKYGLVLDVNGQLEGVLLTIASHRNGRSFCNLSSWYVREGHRQHSIFLLRKAMQNKAVTFTDISPAKTIISMIEKLGFSSHTGGAVLLSPLQISRSGRGRVRSLKQSDVDMLAASDRSTITQHLDYGCTGLWVDDDMQSSEPALYRIKKIKRLLPCARFVSGTPERLIAAAGPLMRALALRGVFLALIDVPKHYTPRCGKLLSGRDMRYVSGGEPPATGDLLETELAIFGL